MAWTDDSGSNNNDPNKNQILSLPPQLSGGGTGGLFGAASSTGSAKPAENANTPSKSGQWENLNSYLDANHDNATKMGVDLAGQVGNQAAQTQSDSGQLLNNFQNQTPFQAIDQTYDGGKMTGVNQSFDKDAVSTYAQSQNQAQPSSAPANSSQTWNPAAQGTLAGAQQDLGDGSAWGLNSANTDIRSFNQGSSGQPTYGALSQEYNNAEQGLKATQSEAGRQNLLQNQYGSNGQYTQGQQKLDQLLLQDTPEAAQQLQSVYSQYAPTMTTNPATGSGVQPGLQQLLDAASAYVGGGNGQTGITDKLTQIQNAAQKALSGDIGGLKTTLQGEEAAKTNDWTNLSSTVAKEIASGQLDPSTAAALGIGAQDLTYGARPSDYWKTANPYVDSNGNPIASAAASDGDFSLFNGLQAIVSGAPAAQATAIPALGGLGLTSGQTQAGATPSIYSQFDKDGFNQTVNTDKGNYNNFLNGSVAPGVITGSGIGVNPGTTVGQLQQVLESMAEGQYGSGNTVSSYISANGPYSGLLGALAKYGMTVDPNSGKFVPNSNGVIGTNTGGVAQVPTPMKGFKGVT